MPGLSSSTISFLKKSWENDFIQWSKRDLSNKHYVYIQADGVHSNVRMDNRLCLLVIIGSDESGRKEVLTVMDEYREFTTSWEHNTTNVLDKLHKAIQPKLIDTAQKSGIG